MLLEQQSDTGSYWQTRALTFHLSSPGEITIFSYLTSLRKPGLKAWESLMTNHTRQNADAWTSHLLIVWSALNYLDFRDYSTEPLSVSQVCKMHFKFHTMCFQSPYSFMYGQGTHKCPASLPFFDSINESTVGFEKSLLKASGFEIHSSSGDCFQWAKKESFHCNNNIP